MTALIIIGAILLVLAIIAFIRFGVSVTYADDDLCVKAVAGPIKLQAYPMRQKQKRKKEKRAAPKKAAAKTEEPSKEPERKPSPDLKLMLSALKESLARLRRKLQIDRLVIHYTAAADSPFTAALSYGYASAAVGVFIPILENSFKIKERDITTNVDFDVEKNIIFVDAQLTLAFWEIIYVAIALLPLKNVMGHQGETGKVENNGQAADK